MATNVDKALYPASQGLEAALGAGLDQPALEIEIEDPESVTLNIDGLEIEIEPQEPTEDDFDANLAEFIDEGSFRVLLTS